MKYSAIIVAAAAFITLAPAAFAQFDFGGGAPPASFSAPASTPWSSFKLNPRVRVTLDFRNASVDAAIHMMSQASGIPIVKDPTLTGPITLQSPTPLPLGVAFAMLNAALKLKNFELVDQDGFLVIQPRAAAGGGGRFGGAAAAAAAAGAFGGGGRTSQLLIKVYPIHYASATDLATEINNLYTTVAQTQTAFPVGAGGPGGGFGFAPPGGAAGATGAAGNGGFGRRGGGGDTGGSGTVKASADQFSNALIVYASSHDQDQIALLILQIDKPTDQPQQIRVFPLQYALAATLQPEIQSILTGTTTYGRAGSSTVPASQNQRGGGGGPGGGGPGGFFQRLLSSGTPNSSSGTVVADSQSNALMVTGTPAVLDEIGKAIKQLDKPAVYQSTTFVYQMKNARADVVANLLNASFGNRTSNGSVGGSLSASSSTGTSSAGSSSNGLPSLTSTSASSQRATSSSLPTFSGNQSQLQQTSGLDAQNRATNIATLYGQVLLIPNIDMNSIIVVAPPQYQPIVKSLLDQMDQIPEQVMIETLVVETSLDKAHQLGVEWNMNQGPGNLGSQTFGLQANTTQPQGLRYTLTAGQYQIFVSALETDTKFNVLSTPRIFTTNNAPAQINISQSLPYLTNQVTEATGTIENSYNFLDVGVVLTVTPLIREDGYVTMDVTQTANDFVSYTSFNAPIVNQRINQTTVSVKDGETIVLGGIINNQVTSTVNKVPLLGDIPLIGNLFRSTSKDNQKTELLVFLTPHVVRDPDEARKLREQTEAELGSTTRQMLPRAAPVEGAGKAVPQPAATPAPVAPAPTQDYSPVTIPVPVQSP